MSDNQTLGFGKFVPGFDFLQNLAKGASQAVPQMPTLASWVAPTLNVEELEKRIADLSGVTPIYIDMCKNSCLAYTGPWKNLDFCVICGHQRYEMPTLPRKMASRSG